MGFRFLFNPKGQFVSTSCASPLTLNIKCSEVSIISLHATTCYCDHEEPWISFLSLLFSNSLAWVIKTLSFSLMLFLFIPHSEQVSSGQPCQVRKVTGGSVAKCSFGLRFILPILILCGKNRIQTWRCMDIFSWGCYAFLSLQVKERQRKDGQRVAEIAQKVHEGIAMAEETGVLMVWIWIC